MPTSPRCEHLVLVGMMGSGKTAVGRRVADRLGRPFVDSDEQVQSHAGRTVREIFDTDGEPAFRRLEAAALAEALAQAEPAVVAAAGGVVLDRRNRRLLAPCTVVWLRVAPEVLAGRVASGDHRPLLGDDPGAALRRLDDERRPLYEGLADHVVDASGPVDEVVDDVLAVVAP